MVWMSSRHNYPGSEIEWVDPDVNGKLRVVKRNYYMTKWHKGAHLTRMRLQRAKPIGTSFADTILAGGHVPHRKAGHTNARRGGSSSQNCLAKSGAFTHDTLVGGHGETGGAGGRGCVPETARLGTVGKFRGQETVAVIVLMTASCSDDLPREISLPFSRNQFNAMLLGSDHCFPAAGRGGVWVGERHEAGERRVLYAIVLDVCIIR